MLTLQDKKYITRILKEDSSERYPLSIAHAFKGADAFDLHASMVGLDESWLTHFTESAKKKSFLLVFLQTTVSKATLKNPYKKPSNPRQKIVLLFDIPDSQTVRSDTGFSRSKGKKWTQLLDDSKNHDAI
jgi:hypothetical protein